MNRHAIYHQVDSDHCYALTPHLLLIKLRSARDDLHSATLCYLDKFKCLFAGQHTLTRRAMHKAYSDQRFDYYEISVPFDVLSMGYCFELHDDNGTLVYGNDQFIEQFSQPEGVAYLKYLFTMPVLDSQDLFNVPDWAGDAVVYQIMPDRFSRSEGYVAQPKHAAWGSAVAVDTYLGGSFDGIRERLPYLEQLGINTLYLTPIFKAAHYHKYCTEDYFALDPDFGSEAQFRALVEAVHQRGMRIVLDGVFSSTGVDFAPFQDLLSQQQQSEYASWFKVEAFPVEVTAPANYACFGHMPILPKFNYNCAEVQAYVLEVLSYWIDQYGIDGWRLDVADEIPHAFWRRARLAVKAVKADALLIGEVWYDSRPWLQGEQFDSVMNYRFYLALLDYLVEQRCDATAFSERISTYLAQYKKQAQPLLWNLIGSHDTARIAQLLNDDRAKQRLAAVLQFTLIGTPVVYYGDEIAMNGANDPHNRQGMCWDNPPDPALRELYRWLIRLYHGHAVLRGCQLQFIETGSALLHYQRGQGDDALVVLINNSPTAVAVDNAENYYDLASSGWLVHGFNLPAYDFRILATKE